jgi:putative hydrolase of the HAD superfamily
VKAVLFDLDDTLYPERSYVHSGFAAVARFLERATSNPAPPMLARLEELHDRDGRGHLFDTLLEELEVTDPGRILTLACIQVYRTHTPGIAPFPKVLGTLHSLQADGLLLGLVSDGMASVQRRKLDALHGIARLLDVVVLTDELGHEYWKPSPVPFQVACALLGVSSGEAAYVGNDPRKDFAGARTAGLRTLRVGLPPQEGGIRVPTGSLVDDADAYIEPFAELPAALGLADAPA